MQSKESIWLGSRVRSETHRDYNRQFNEHLSSEFTRPMAEAGLSSLPIDKSATHTTSLPHQSEIETFHHYPWLGMDHYPTFANQGMISQYGYIQGANYPNMSESTSHLTLFPYDNLNHSTRLSSDMYLTTRQNPSIVLSTATRGKPLELSPRNQIKEGNLYVSSYQHPRPLLLSAACGRRHHFEGVCGAFGNGHYFRPDWTASSEHYQSSRPNILCMGVATPGPYMNPFGINPGGNENNSSNTSRYNHCNVSARSLSYPRNADESDSMRRNANLRGVIVASQPTSITNVYSQPQTPNNRPITGSEMSNGKGDFEYRKSDVAITPNQANDGARFGIRGELEILESAATCKNETKSDNCISQTIQSQNEVDGEPLLSQTKTMAGEARAKRIMRNRESARRSRMRSKLHLQSLEKKYTELCMENVALRDLFDSLVPKHIRDIYLTSSNSYIREEDN